MNTEKIIQALEGALDRIDQELAALRGQRKALKSQRLIQQGALEFARAQRDGKLQELFPNLFLSPMESKDGDDTSQD